MCLNSSYYLISQPLTKEFWILLALSWEVNHTCSVLWLTLLRWCHTFMCFTLQLGLHSVDPSTCSVICWFVDGPGFICISPLSRRRISRTFGPYHLLLLTCWWLSFPLMIILPADNKNNVVSLAEEVQLWSINHGHESNRCDLCFISSSTDSKTTWTYQEP